MRPTFRVKFPLPSTILLFITLTTVVAFPKASTFRSTVFFLLTAYLLFLMFVNRGPIRWIHAIWVIGFYGLSVLSQKWAYYPDGAKVIVGNIMHSMLLSWSAAEYIYQGKRDIEHISNIMKALSVLVLINFALNAEVSASGRYTLNINANSMGMNAAYLFGFVLFSAKTAHFKKVGSNILCVLLTVVTLLTGSRKALLMIVLFVVAFFFMWVPENDFRKTLGRVIGLVCLCAVGWFLLMKVEVLYNAVGHRLESLYLYWVQGEEVDASAISRSNMANIAIKIFKLHPVLGNGHNAFKYLSGYFTYCHNNYLEILCSLGVTGFLVYYPPLIYFTIQAFILWRKKVHGAILPLTVLLLEFLNGFGRVSYYSVNIHIIMGIAIGIIYLLRKQNRIDFWGKRILSPDRDGKVSGQ